MQISRRTLLKITGIGTAVICCVPKMAFAARNSLRSVRTGVQPNNKTRLVIETTLRPSYSLSYAADKLTITFSNMSANAGLKPTLANNTLAKSITQAQLGDKVQIIASLTTPIAEIPKNQIMLLEPNGDNAYRLVLDFVATTGTVSAATTTAKKTTTSKKPIIVIDAGHGGKDPGCIGKGGTREKTVVLATAKKLKTKLENAGFIAYLTRSTDVYLKLATRSSIAEKHKADLFLSLHANANPSRAMKGFSIYTLSEKASDEEAKKLAEAENAADKIDVAGFEEFEPNIRSALSALQQHAVAEMSEEYANGCSNSFRGAKITPQPGPGVRHAAFAVLRSTVPGALIELGHLSNAAEEGLLKTSSYQDKLATAILSSIKKYNFDV